MATPKDDPLRLVRGRRLDADGIELIGEDMGPWEIQHRAVAAIVPGRQGTKAVNVRINVPGLCREHWRTGRVEGSPVRDSFIGTGLMTITIPTHTAWDGVRHVGDRRMRTFRKVPSLAIACREHEGVIEVLACIAYNLASRVLAISSANQALIAHYEEVRNGRA